MFFDCQPNLRNVQLFKPTLLVFCNAIDGCHAANNGYLSSKMDNDEIDLHLKLSGILSTWLGSLTYTTVCMVYITAPEH